MSFRKAFWTFTYIPKEGTSADVTTAEGVEHVLDGISYNVGVGPLEQKDNTTEYPHHHGWIRCSPGTCITKGKAIKILEQLGLYNDGQYVHELISTKRTYINYCFKHFGISDAETIIKNAVSEIRLEGIKPTKTNVVARLAEENGAKFITVNKSLIDNFMSTPVLSQTKKRMIEEVIDPMKNLNNFINCVQAYSKIIKNNVVANGIDTTHRSFENSSRSDQIRAILINTLLPICVQRKRVVDNLPALWFYGEAGSGKSFMFTQIPNYRHVSTDAAGVSRFRLNGDQSAFLLDDTEKGFIIRENNASLIKKLCIGETTAVKVFGDVMDVRGFVAITSNHKPDYMIEPEVMTDTEYQAFKWNLNAFNRRIIAVKFTDKVDIDPIFVDFGVSYLDAAAANIIMDHFEQIKSEPLRQLYFPYYEWLKTNQTEEDRSILNSFDDYTEEEANKKAKLDD